MISFNDDCLWRKFRAAGSQWENYIKWNGHSRGITDEFDLPSYESFRHVPSFLRDITKLRKFAGASSYIVDSPRGFSMFTVRVTETSVKTNARWNLRRILCNILSRIFSSSRKPEWRFGNAKHYYRDLWRES